MKSNLTKLLLLLLLPAASFSQTASMTNVVRYSASGSGIILNNNELQGYWSFFIKERDDKKNYAYEIMFHDNNLKKVASFNVIKPTDTHLIEIVSNDSSFLMTFYEKKGLIFEIYNHAGKKTGSKTVTEISKWELLRITQALKSSELADVISYGIGKNGFVRNGYTKNEKVGYELVAYDNAMKQLWSFGSDPKSKLLEYGTVMSASEKYVGVSVIRKTSLLTKEYDSFFILLDAKTGAKIMEVPMHDKTHGELSLINLNIDESKNEILLLGEYYNPGDEVLKDQSQGVYVQRLDMEGKEMALAKYSWSKEIAKLRKASMTDEQASSDKGKKLLYIHKIVISSTGDIYAVGEEYRKTVSAMGALSREAADMQLTVEDLVVIQINSKLELVGYKLVSKKKNRVILPAGYSYANAQLLAAYVKATGGFDYQYTSIDRAKSSGTIIYSDMNRKEESGSDKADVMIGSITIDADGIEAKRTPLNSETSYVTYQPAKAGYIMVIEYFKKEKKVDMHLEKI